MTSRTSSYTASWRKVRSGWKWNLWYLTTMFAVWFLIMSAFGGASNLNERPITVALVLAATIVMAFVIPRLTYFKYSIGYSGHIEASNPWRGGWRYYPRPGYSHLEYSIASREIHEIRRRDGKRHRVPVWASRANPTDWQEFVETFFPAAGLPIALLAPESEGSPESADVGRESD